MLMSLSKSFSAACTSLGADYLTLKQVFRYTFILHPVSMPQPAHPAHVEECQNVWMADFGKDDLHW